MKIRNYFSCVCAAFIAALSLVGCSDYDNGYTDKVIAYERDFHAAFGDISPEQDWNVATRGNVTVTTSKSSNVKIYAYDGLNYSIVGDYSDVIGTRTLGFDVAKGVKKILVSDGRNGQKTTVGGSVSFENRSTRNVHVGEDGIVSTTGMYVEFPYEDAIAYQKELREIGTENGELGNNTPYENTNLPKVTKNFKYISNGDFTIHPVYWNTDNTDEIGVYYTDDDGDHTVRVYTIKGKGENAALQDLKWRYIVVDDFKATNLNEAISEIETRLKTGTFGDLVTEDKEVTDNSYSGNNIISKVEWDDGSQRYYITGTDGTKYILKYYFRKGDTDEITKEECTHTYFRVYEIRDIPNDKWTTSGYEYGQTDTQRSKEITISIPKDVEFGMYLKWGEYTFYSEASLNGKYGEKGYSGRFPEQYRNMDACYAASIDINDEKYLCFEDWPDGDFDLNDVVFKFSGNVPELIDGDIDVSATWDILCEDLGGSFDTDFNDVVLKVGHVSGRKNALVTPQAAGGTLASYTFFRTKTLGEDGSEKVEFTQGREIHQRFSGVVETESGKFTPIDVDGDNEKDRENEGRQIEIDVPEDWSLAYYRADNYENKVENKEGGYWSNEQYMNMGGFIVKVLPEGITAPYHLDFDDKRFGEASVIASPDKGDVPQMICVPDQYNIITSEIEDGETKFYRTTYKFAWSPELVSLATSYAENGHKFSDWVSSYRSDKPDGLDWYKYPTGNYVKRVQVGSRVECDENGNVEGEEDEKGENDNTIDMYINVVRHRNNPYSWLPLFNEGSYSNTDVDIKDYDEVDVQEGDWIWVYIYDNISGTPTGRDNVSIIYTHNGNTEIYENVGTEKQISITGDGLQTIKIIADADEEKGYRAKEITITFQIGTTVSGDDEEYEEDYPEAGTYVLYKHGEKSFLKIENNALKMGNLTEDDTPQQWTIEYDENGYFTLKNESTEEYVYGAENSTWDVSLKETKPDTDNSHALYKFEANEDGSYKIYNKYNDETGAYGKYLGLNGNIMFDRDANGAYSWDFVPVSSIKRRITNMAKKNKH